MVETSAETLVLMADPAATMARWQLPVFDSPAREERGGLHTAAQLDEIEAAAYQEGLRRGETEGYAMGQRNAQKEVERLRALIDHMQRPLAHLDEEVERTLLEAACAIARRLLQAELSQNPDVIAAIVREALAALPSYVRDVRLHLHADDAAFLSERVLSPPEAQSFRIVVDAALSRGDCRVLTESTQLDARLDTRLQVLRAALDGGGA